MSYDIDCPYGGLGNWMGHDATCLACDYEIECEHEKNLMDELSTSRRRRIQYRSGPVRAFSYPRRTAPKRQEETKRSRPLPAEGESLLSRLFKNVGAAALSGAGEEFGHSCRGLKERKRKSNGPIVVLMGLAGCEKIGEEISEFFEEYDFPPTINLLPEGERRLALPAKREDDDDDE